MQWLEHARCVIAERLHERRLSRARRDAMRRLYKNQEERQRIRRDCLVSSVLNTTLGAR